MALCHAGYGSMEYLEGLALWELAEFCHAAREIAKGHGGEG